MSDKRGTVYIFKNPCILHPDTKEPLYKIGRTQNLPRRLRDLHSTGIPLPFDCVFACEVDDYRKVEQELQKGFGDYRLTRKREFFSINPNLLEMIISLLKVAAGFRDVTEEVSEKVEAETVKADSELKETAEVPANYHTYENLKGNLRLPEGFFAGYFGIRVSTRHRQQGVPVYKRDGKAYYRKDIFEEQARTENLWVGS